MRCRVLIVENDRSRLHALKRRCRSSVVHIATNYQDAVAALSASRYDLVLLDHDLDDCDRNGQDLTCWMRRMRRSTRPEVVIHSTNLRGAYAMEVQLRQAGFEVTAVPFDWVTNAWRAAARRSRRSWT